MRSFGGYIFVSGVCLLLNNVILIFADAIGCALLVSVLLSYCVVVVTGYLLHSFISFRQPLSIRAFGRYAFAMAINIPLLFGIVWVWRNAVGLPMSLSAPAATACMFFINFLLCRWAVSAKQGFDSTPLRSGMGAFDSKSMRPGDAPINGPCVLAPK